MGSFFSEIKKAEKCDKLSDPVDKYVIEPIGMVFTKLFLKFKIHPNFVTLLSTISGIIGGLLFVHKALYLNIIGIFLVILSAVFDVCDGQVARLGTKRSPYGRLLDGIGDSLVYTAIYIGISIKLMDEYIPFTNVLWGYYIWIISILCGVFVHSGQARIADYLRCVHTFTIKNEKGTEFITSQEIKDSIKGKKVSLFEKIKNAGYYSYTRMQENYTPNIQKLIKKFKSSDDENVIKARKEFGEASDKLVAYTNLLTFNLRTFVLFVLILINQLFYVFVFAIIIMDFVRFVLTLKYEKRAKEVYKKYFADQDIYLENFKQAV